jgi:molecular chaperone HtpG
MKEGQKEIYYIVGSNRDSLLTDPHLEIFKNKGLEVLFLYDPVDEFVIQAIRKYKDYEIKSVTNIDLKKINEFKDVEEKKNEVEPLSKDDQKHFYSLLSKMKSILGDRVEDVVESKRLVDSASCLVSKDETISSQMKKILKMTKQDFSIDKKIMEVNPNHKLIRNLVKVFKKNSLDDFISLVTEQLYDAALLQEGNLEDPHKLIERLNKTLEQSSEWYTKVNNIE